MESTPEGSEEKESGSATESKELMLEGDEGKKYGTVSDLPIEEKAAEEQHCQRKKLCDLPHLVEPAFFFYMLAIWSYLPLNEQYVYMRLEADTPPHRSVTHEESKCFGNHTPAEQARDDYIKVTLSNYTLLYNIFETLPAIVVSLVLCSWGDKHGRKLGLIFPCIGGVIKGILYILADIYGWSIDFLILPNAIEGFSGSHMTIAGSAYAYVADVVPPSKITFRFAVLNALLFAGSSVGNVAIGYMIRGLGFLTSFFIMTIWYAIALIYIIFFVPESIIEKPEDRPISICASIKELWEATAAAFKVYVIQRPDKGAKWRLILMLIASTLHAILVLGQVELDTLYLIGPPFCFNPIEVGYFLAFLCATSVIGPVAGTKLFEKLGLADATMGIIASISGAGAFLLQAFATSREAIFLGKTKHACAMYIVLFSKYPSIYSYMEELAVHLMVHDLMLSLL